MGAEVNKQRDVITIDDKTDLLIRPAHTDSVLAKLDIYLTISDSHGPYIVVERNGRSLCEIKIDTFKGLRLIVWKDSDEDPYNIIKIREEGNV